MDAGSQREERTIIDLRTAPASSPTARQSALRRHLAEFVVLVSPEGRLLDAVDVPPELEELRRSQGRHVAELVHPDDLPLILGTATRALRQPGTEQAARIRVRRSGGDWLTVDTVAVDARSDPELRGLVVRVRQVDPGSAPPPAVLLGAGLPSPPLEDDRAGSRFTSLAEALPLGILSADGFGTVVYANGVAGELLGTSADELLGSGWERAVHPEDRPRLVDAVALVLDAGVRQHVEFRLAHDDGRWIAALLVPLGDADRPAGWLATIDDVTDRLQAQLQLAHQATHDPLTRLPNRTLLEDRLRQAGERLRREPGRVVSVLFVDLDDFKGINDTHGHGAGDRVLVELGRRLSEVIRSSDTVARFGGDEFVAVCESNDTADVDAVVERMREAIGRPIEVGSGSLQVGATIGVATTDVALDDMFELLLDADERMYRRKRRR